MARRRADVESRNPDHAARIIGLLGAPPAEQLLAHPEIASDRAAVLLIQLARRSALDELLDVSGILADQARQASIILPAFLEKAVESFARIEPVHTSYLAQDLS